MILSAKIARYILIFATIIVLAIVLPELYSMLFYKSFPSVRVNYSPISNEFLITEYMVDRSIRRDSKGNEITREKMERLTPFASYRQLVYRDEMPDSVQGIPIDLKELRLNNIFIQLRPKDINTYTIPINPLLESKPGRANLSMPNDFFRINNKFEFLDCSTNKVIPELSELFNNALTDKGFQFPAKSIFGNPTTRKPFDEGFFIVDDNDQLFHLKRIHNKPYVAKVEIPSDMKIRFIAVREMDLKEFYALIITNDNKLFLISYDNYKLIELPSDGFNVNDSRLIFRGNLLYREVNFIKDNSIKTYITDRNYKIVDSYFQKWESNEESSIGIFERTIFPFKLSVSDKNSSLVSFNITFSDFQLMLGNIFVMLIGIALFETKFKRNKITKLIDLAIILFTGVYGLIATLLIRDEE